MSLLKADDRGRESSERKVQAGFLLALACLLTVGVLYYASMQRLRANAARVDHTYQVQTALGQLLALTAEAEAAGRGLIITADEGYQRQFDDTATRLVQVERELAQLIADNASQKQRLRLLTDLVGDRMNTLKAAQSAWRKDGFAAAQRLLQQGPGRSVQSQLRNQIEAIAGAENSLLQERQRLADRSTSLSLGIGVGGTVLALMFVAWAAFVGRRGRLERRRIEGEREAFKGRLTAQLEDMRRLHQFSSRLVEIGGTPEMLEEILDATMKLQNADFGNIQLYDAHSDTLRIVAQRGFSPTFLEHFRTVSAHDASVCGRAMQRRERIVVEDVRTDVAFEPHRPAAAQAGFRGVQSTPIIGRDGTIRGVLSTHFRETHRPADRELQLTDLYLHTAAALIERVQDMEAVRAAKQEAERANRSKGRFLSAASHDLRQPLQTLSLLNGALRRLVDEPDAAQAVMQQQQTINAMSELINALLDIGKLESGAVRPQFTQFRIGELLLEMHAEFAEPAAHKHLRLQVSSAAESVVSDRALLGQILRNLLGNAIRYTRSGSIALRVQRDQERLRIDVADTGIGIAEEQLNSIFEEFYQVGVPANGTREGHGLGLNIVQRTARLLGHELSVQSTPGKGSVFSIWVPLSAIPAAERLPVPAGAAGDAGSRREHVLLVDDDRAVLDATRLLLKVEGYQVTVGTCLSEAVDRAREDRDIQLLITDFHLSDGNRGTDVMMVVQNILGRRIKTVLITGDTSSAMGQIVDDSSIRVASKPIRAEELLDLLRT